MNDEEIWQEHKKGCPDCAKGERCATGTLLLYHAWFSRKPITFHLKEAVR